MINNVVAGEGGRKLLRGGTDPGDVWSSSRVIAVTRDQLSGQRELVFCRASQLRVGRGSWGLVSSVPTKSGIVHLCLAFGHLDPANMSPCPFTHRQGSVSLSRQHAALKIGSA